MTSEELRKLAELCDAATRPPWLNAGYDWSRGQIVVAGPHKSAVCQVYGSGCHRPSMSDDAQFIAAARTAVPQLLAELDRLTNRVAELEAPQDKWIVVDRRDGHIIGACPLCGCEYSIGEYEEGGTGGFFDRP